MAKQYLAETDPVLKRYYACHCPWARDAVKDGNVALEEVFCYCSGGFHKKALGDLWAASEGGSARVDTQETLAAGLSTSRRM